MSDWGVTRITNPATLRRWKNNGKYQELIDAGYTFAYGCGRFRKGVCTCTYCRRFGEKNKLKFEG